ncbi:laccase-17-like [Dorcoceras hygrometricum]|uniref:Laccase-17-like n=1 Tax=Dorcoceras hygrometricum TaxID=472368 RepID=A0A2Z7AFD1_9LAMI|nr:laccase-17-like [Dorcoceras hygrometricum]
MLRAPPRATVVHGGGHLRTVTGHRHCSCVQLKCPSPARCACGRSTLQCARAPHAAGTLRVAPGSDEIHRESGTSKSALEDLTNFSRTDRRRDRNKSNHEENGRRWAAAGGRRRKAASGGREMEVERGAASARDTASRGLTTLRLQNHNFGLTHRIMVKRLATSPHDPLGITDSACKNYLVMVSVQYGPFNTYIPFRSTTIGISRVARDPITMHTSRRSNSDIVSVTRYNKPLTGFKSLDWSLLHKPTTGSQIPKAGQPDDWRHH